MFRWIVLGVLALDLSISAHYRRKARKAGGRIERRREGGVLLLLRALIALPLGLAILAWVLEPRSMDWSGVALPGWLRWIGAGAGALTVPSALWVFRSLGGNVSETVLTKEAHALVTTGPYRWVRHPLYTTGLTLLASIGLMAANGLVLGLAALALLLILAVVIPEEEAHLLRAFPEEYAAYRRRTGRLLPRSVRGAK